MTERSQHTRSLQPPTNKIERERKKIEQKGRGMERNQGPPANNVSITMSPQKHATTHVYSTVLSPILRVCVPPRNKCSSRLLNGLAIFLKNKTEKYFSIKVK
ncbi:hypothetical protein PoB_004286500 [Plakobranchus ocellatus]|uniref:Uncharacterized protein n=1 Tax=Plakobranchus ocellatus TaxID=259542 RepID=A0AAV4B6Y0_9GAST|nr:hypothetical protein PoB_004286500 [Plakobranchus ocellatus]